jgi:hypothetical protein
MPQLAGLLANSAFKRQLMPETKNQSFALKTTGFSE